MNIELEKPYQDFSCEIRLGRFSYKFIELMSCY